MSLFRARVLTLVLSVLGMQLMGQSGKSARNAIGEILPGERELVDVCRDLLEAKIVNLRFKMHVVLVNRGIATALGLQQPLTQEQKQFMAVMHSELAQKPTPSEEQQRLTTIRRPSKNMTEALIRYKEAELRRVKLVGILLPGTPTAELEELRKEGIAIDPDPDMERLQKKYR